MDIPRLIEVEQLQALLANPPAGDLLLVDVGAAKRYQTGHIPKAVLIEPRQIMSGQAPVPGRRPSEQQLQQLASDLGLTDDTHVLVYDDEGGGWAGRFIWTLDLLQHKHYSYVNGGLSAWQAEGYPLSSQPQLRASKPYTVNADYSVAADKDYIVSQLDNPNCKIWDARSAAEYRGEKSPSARKGHIPGAIHLDWEDTKDANRSYRLRLDIAELLQSKGLTAQSQIITHCQSHHRSGLTYLIAKLLGYPNVKAYDGSWSEWGNDPNTPVA